MRKLLLVSSDLMIISRMQGVATGCGLSLKQVSSPSQAAEMCDTECPIAILDLQTRDLQIKDLVVELLDQNPQIAIIASGPHVHEDRLEAARQAGCAVVVSRGQLDREAQGLIETLLERN